MTLAPLAVPSLTTTYYSAGAQMIAMREVTSTVYPAGTLYYLHTDHLGSTSLVTSITGSVVSRQSYYAYGGVRSTSGTLPTDIGYTGQRLDGTGLMYYNARYYAPGLGRFVSADTIVPGAGNPQAFNRYSYVLGNPLKYTDPTGHSSCDTSTKSICYGSEHGFCLPGVGCSGGEHYAKWWRETNLPSLQRDINHTVIAS